MQCMPLSTVLCVEWAMTTKDSVFPELEEDQPVDEIPNDPRPHTSNEHASNGGYEEQHRAPPKHQGVISMYLAMYLITECTVTTLFLWFPDAYIVGVLLKLIGICRHKHTS